MYTAIRLKLRTENDTIVISFPELRKLRGRDLEVIIMVEGEIEDSSLPPRAVQNSKHIPGAALLDEEAVIEYLRTRFR
ncbi:MAG TPA: hypothetical protein VHO70_11410 [Chitinispirillaceae bacterium]|nr:hypothetical protein [Chitinispirillaceae bacterium]